MLFVVIAKCMMTMAEPFVSHAQRKVQVFVMPKSVGIRDGGISCSIEVVMSVLLKIVLA